MSNEACNKTQLHLCISPCGFNVFLEIFSTVLLFQIICLLESRVWKYVHESRLQNCERKFWILTGWRKVRFINIHLWPLFQAQTCFFHQVGGILLHCDKIYLFDLKNKIWHAKHYYRESSNSTVFGTHKKPY